MLSILVDDTIRQNPRQFGNTKKLSAEGSHKVHDLVEIVSSKHDAGISSAAESSAVTCSACVLPITSPPFYKCTHQPNCLFHLHHFCANQLPISQRLFKLREGLSHSVFLCDFCRRPCNGFGYSYKWKWGFRDVECAYSPKALKHASHDQHILFLTSSTSENMPPSSFDCCPENDKFRWFYRCLGCNDFIIHQKCALLPKTARHKFDKHPLKLIFTNINNDDEDCFCEVCEKDMNTNYWFYYCKDLHPDHPMTLTRMLMQGSQRCRHCKEIIRGFEDGMSFHCAKCYIWFHYECAMGPIPDPDTDTSRFFMFDCGHPPLTLNHASHERHSLSRVPGYFMIESLACCSDNKEGIGYYSCFHCDFIIHDECALLPKAARHNKFDKHPLRLITKPINNSNIQQLDTGGDNAAASFCKVCEKYVDQKYWFYYCGKCEHYFHLHCVPSSEFPSQVKFGATFDDLSIHPNHSVTLTRLAVDGSERCGSCNKIIQLFEDCMAFHCAECCIWFGFYCALDRDDGDASRFLISGVGRRVSETMSLSPTISGCRRFFLMIFVRGCRFIRRHYYVLFRRWFSHRH